MGDMELEAEIMTQLLNKLLIPSQREAREMVDAENDEDEMETADAKMETDMAEATVEGDAKVLEDSEALREAKQMEVARFNNYIDAIYRRMNAALKAKLMDPMELNLDEKVKKNSEDKKKAKKSRVLREAVDVEDQDQEVDIEVDRMGKPSNNGLMDPMELNLDEKVKEDKKKAKKSRVLREAVEDVDVEDQDQELDIEVDRMGKPSNKGGNKKKGKGKSKEERQTERQRKKDLRKKKKDENDGNEKDGKEKDMSAKEKRRALKKN